MDNDRHDRVTPLDAIAEVEQLDEAVLRCILPNGLTVDHKPLPLKGVDGTMWVMFHERDKRGRTGTRQGVVNMAESCDPDVWIIHESRSLFAEDLDDE